MTALGMRTPVLYLTVSSMSYGDSYFPYFVSYLSCSFILIILMLADCTFEPLVPAFEDPGSYTKSFNYCLYSLIWPILFGNFR